MASSQNFLIAVAIWGSGLTIGAQAARAQGAAATPSDRPGPERQWYPVPTILPSGARVTFVSGDPFKAGEFSVEFMMPDGYTLPPHTNPAREHVTIVSGALRVGLGRKI